MSVDEGNQTVLECFASDPYLADITSWLMTLQTLTPLNTAESRRARQQSLEYMVKGGKLWRVGGKQSHRAPQAECIPASEGKARAKQCHEDRHWGRDLCETQLHMSCFWPCMRRDIIDAI
ncbi:hypothetical protein K439DRAFT_1365806, partial [Ramaria rubella]